MTIGNKCIQRMKERKKCHNWHFMHKHKTCSRIISKMLTAPEPEQLQTTKGFVCDISEGPDQYINASVTNLLLTSWQSLSYSTKILHSEEIERSTLCLTICSNQSTPIYTYIFDSFSLHVCQAKLRDFSSLTRMIHALSNSHTCYMHCPTQNVQIQNSSLLSITSPLLCTKFPSASCSQYHQSKSLPYRHKTNFNTHKTASKITVLYILM
jgi:hypothetical protein